MTNEEMLRRLYNGELPCEIIDEGPKDTLKPGVRLCVIPQDTLRLAADGSGFVQVYENEIIAELAEDEVFWVQPSHKHRSIG